MLSIDVDALEGFENITEAEIMHTWRSIRLAKAMSDDDAWSTIVVSIALDNAFGKTIAVRETEQ